MPAAGVTAVIGQDVTTQGLPTATSSPTDLSISGNGFFVVATNSSATAHAGIYPRRQLHPGRRRQPGERRRACICWATSWTARATCPPTPPTFSLINVSSLSGTAQATTKLSLQANLQSSSTVDSTYTAGDMASGTVTPDFKRTINVYDSQGGSQPSPSPSSRPAPTPGPMKPPMPAPPPTSPAPTRSHRHRVVQFRRHAGQCQRRVAGHRAHLTLTIPVGGLHRAWPARPSRSTWAPSAAPAA